MEERLTGSLFSLCALVLAACLFWSSRLARIVDGRASCTLESGRRGLILHLSLGMQVPRPAHGCSIFFFVVCVLGWFVLWIDRNLFPRPLDHNLRPRLPDFLRVLSVGVGVTSSARFAGGRQDRSKGSGQKARVSHQLLVSFRVPSLVVPRRACAESTRGPAGVRGGGALSHPPTIRFFWFSVVRKTYLCGQS